MLNAVPWEGARRGASHNSGCPLPPSRFNAKRTQNAIFAKVKILFRFFLISGNILLQVFFVKAKWHKVNSQKVRSSWRRVAGTGKGLGWGEG